MTSSTDPSSNARRPGRPRELAAAMLVLGLECVVPLIGGLVGFVRGLVALLASRSDITDASAHVTDLPLTPIAKAQAGATVRVRGLLSASTPVRSLLTGEEVALAMVSGFRSVEDGTAPLAPRGFGAGLEGRDEGGVAALDLGDYQVLSRHIERAGPARSSDPRVKAALERAYPRFADADGRFSLTETTLAPGEMVEVIGRVVDAEAVEMPSEQSYRELRRARRITMSRPEPGGALLITTYDQRGLAELIVDARRTRAIAKWQLGLGVVNIAAGAALLWWLLR